MNILKRILLMLGLFVCICQIAFASPKDEAKRINELYAIPIEVTVLNWYLSLDNLVQINKSDGIHESEYRRRLADIAVRADGDLKFVMERLHKEQVPKELELLKVSIISTGAVGRVIANDTLDLSDGVLSLKEYFEKLEYNLMIYERSLNWIEREYFNLTSEFRGRK